MGSRQSCGYDEVYGIGTAKTVSPVPKSAGRTAAAV